MIKVIVLPRHSPLGASSRVRFFEHFKDLEELGVDIVAVSPFFTEEYLKRSYANKKISIPTILKRYLRRLWILTQCRKCDVIWLENEFFPLAPQWCEKIVTKLISKPIIVDIDDDIFTHYKTFRNAYLRTYLRQRRPLVSKNVSYYVSNVHLQSQFALRWGVSAKVLPGSLNLSRYPTEVNHHLNIHDLGKPPILGWIGTPLTSRLHLNSSITLLLMLSRDFEIHLIGADRSIFGKLNSNIKVIDWTLENEIAEIIKCDIGIMPLPDDEFSKSKSGYKAIQFLACGKPVISSYLEFTKDLSRKYGLIPVSTDEEWLLTITDLVDNPLKYNRLSVQGFNGVRSDYDPKTVSQLIARILANAI